MKKRILPLLLSLVMLFSLFPVEVLAAEPEMTITVGSVTATASDTDVEIPVSVENASPVMMMGLEFVLPEELTLKGIAAGESATAAGASVKSNVSAGTVNFEADSNVVFQNGTILTLTVDVSSSASGSLTIQVRPINNIAGMIANEEEEEVPVTFVSGTITVKASTMDRTVKFMNGTTEVKTETVANGGTLSTIPEAPAATDGQSFLGWYAVDGTDYVLDNIDDKITGTEASTETAIYADTTYQAIWASSAMIAAGYKTADGKTTISGVSQAANLQTLVTNHNGGTVKLLRDVELGSTYLAVAEGSALTLDLNGKTLSGNGCIDTENFNGDYGILLNNGTLALISSAETRGKIALADAGQSQFGYAAVENKGLITRMEKIDVEVTTAQLGQYISSGATAFNSSGTSSDTTSVAVQKIDNCSFSATKASAFTQSYGPLGEITNSTFTGGYHNEDQDMDFSAVDLANETLALLKDCTITNDQSGGEALYISYNSTIGSIENCDITGPNGIVIKGYGTSYKSVIQNLSADITANNGYALTVEDLVAEIAISGGKYKGSVGLFNTRSDTTITYPAGKTLLEGADGYWTLSKGYNVYFRNWDETLLQQVSCAANGTAAYTKETPIRGADENYVYTFREWNTQKDGTGTAYTENRISNVTSDLTLYAQYSTASAKVVSLSYGSGSAGSGGTLLKSGNYASLKAAVDALNSNSGSYNNVVITLNEDAVETSKVEVKKNVTIDLNGHKLSINNDGNGIEIPAYAAMSKAVTLTIKDSAGNGRYEHTSGVAGVYAIKNGNSVFDAQTVAIESGTIEEKGAGCSAICAAGNYSRVNIQGGTIIGAENGLAVTGGSFAISGGTIQGGTNGVYVSGVDSNDRRSSISGGDIIANGAEGYALKVEYANPVTYVDLSGGRFKNTATPDNLYPAKDNNGADVVLTFLDGKSLSPAADSEGFYAVRVVGSYTLVLTADKDHYNAGETVTVTVSAYGTTAGSINSFGFTPSFADTKLTFESVTPANTGSFSVNKRTGKSGYVVEGKGGITLGTTYANATKLATIIFTAKENINNDTAMITLTDLEMTKSGSSTGDSVTVEKDLTVTLHDIRVTLTAANGSINGETSLNLYAKYGEVGLYSDAGRTTAASVEVSANDGYRLNDKAGESLWKDEAGADCADPLALTYTGNKTFALQTTKTWTITFDVSNVVGGTLASTTPITADDETTFGEAGLPAAKADPGYTFYGWMVLGKMEAATSQEVFGNYIVCDGWADTSTGKITLIPRFNANVYTFDMVLNGSETKNLYGTHNISGYEGQFVTHGKDVTFKLNPVGQNLITGVSYTMNGSTMDLTADESGVYTISGEDILGDITVTVTTQAYYKVTFQGGTGNTVAETTLYIKDDDHTFYTGADFTTEGAVPEVAAAEGYRLNTDALWSDGNGKTYTAETLKTATFTANTTLTAQSVKIQKVTFAPGDHGSFAEGATTAFTVDVGSTLGQIDGKPTPIADAGYQFTGWDKADTTVVEEGKDLTVTAQYTNASYKASLDGGDAATVTVTKGITNGKATHDTDIKFTLKVNDGHKVTKVSYQIDGGEAQEITPDNDGVYTIPGGAITGDVKLVLTTNQTYTITFAAGENGSVGGTTSFTLDHGAKLTEAQLDSVTKTGNTGYTFKEWQINGQTVTDADITSTDFNANTTITAFFDHATYAVTAEGISGVPANATHGTDLVFTPSVAGKVVTGITATINGNAVTVTKNSNGTYTIAGSDITGALIITATTVTGGWKFITKDSGYAVLTTSEQIAIFEADRLSGGTYLLDGKQMFYSSKYSGYVKIVAVTETAETLSAKLTIGTAATTDISYSGDINDVGGVTPADGGMINDALHEVDVTYELTEKQRLEMDVNGDKKVTTADIVTILQTYVGVNNQ